MSYLDKLKQLEQSGPKPAAAASGLTGNGVSVVDPTEGPIIAVLIDSPVVGLVWFALDDDFKSGDAIPVFYASELPHLWKMSPEELRRRYEEKLALEGGRIQSRSEGPTRH